MGKKQVSPLGLTKKEIATALKRYKVLCEHHSNKPACSFHEWEVQALARVFARIKDDDPDAVALLCHMIQYCMEKDRVAGWG